MANVVSHTAADAETQILGQPVYIGKLQRGNRILIVDDVITFGSTLANLREFRSLHILLCSTFGAD
jgi:predicted amidophosphoribosyltransferase